MALKTIIITIAAVGFSAVANAAMPRVNCQKDQLSPYRDLVSNVNLVRTADDVTDEDVDDRVYLDESGLNADVQEQLRNATGYVACGNHQPGSGSLVRYAETLFVCTNVHVIADSNGDVRDPVAGCAWQNQSTANPVRLQLDTTSERFKLPTRNTLKDQGLDRICITLKKGQMIPKAVNRSAIQIDGENCPQVGQELYAISARENDMLSRPYEPIVRRFTVSHFDRSIEGSVYVGDGDFIPGSSGGLNFVVEQNRVVGCGIHSGSAPQDYNGRRFNKIDSYSQAIAFDERLKLEMAAAAVAGSGTASISLPKPNPKPKRKDRSARVRLTNL